MPTSCSCAGFFGFFFRFLRFLAFGGTAGAVPAVDTIEGKVSIAPTILRLLIVQKDAFAWTHQGTACGAGLVRSPDVFPWTQSRI